MNQSKHIIYGLHACKAALQQGHIQQLYVLKQRKDRRLQAVIDIARQQNLAVEFTVRDHLDQLTHGGNHQGAVGIGEAQSQRHYTESDLEPLLADKSQALVLVLDGIQDPHNLGACLRSACAAHVDCVIIPKDHSAPLTATVSKVACGAAEVVPFIAVSNLARTLQQLKDLGLWLVALAGETEQSIYEVDLTGNVAIVMGNEGNGLRRLTKEHCDYVVRIPMNTTVVDSLNVSVATGISLFEAQRQRA